MAGLGLELRLASGTNLDPQGAANAWAGTTGLDLLGALNVKAGTTGVGWAKTVRFLNTTYSRNIPTEPPHVQ